LTNVLHQGFGLARGDRIAVLAGNRLEYSELLFAASLGSFVVVPISQRAAVREGVEILEDADVSALVVERGFEETVEGARGAGFTGPIVWLGNDYEALLADAAARHPGTLADPADVVLQAYTSGVTGRPKGALISNRNLLAATWGHLAEHSILKSDRYLTTAPLSHLGGGSRILLTTHATATHVIHRRFDPDRVVDSLASGDSNITLIVPAMLRDMLVSARERGNSFPDSVRAINYSMAPMPLDLLIEAMEVLKCDFQQTYGQTEASPTLTILPPEDHRPMPDGTYAPHLASVGRQLVGVQMRVVDADHVDVPVGETGELVARGDCVMRGYWRLPEETEAALRGGWLHTGDLGAMDEDGYIYLRGRAKDMLISGGLNIYPREVESQLEQHELVVEAAVVGVPDERWGEVPVAYVVSKGDVSSDQLQAFLDGRLARYKIPRRYELVDDLPRSSTGKVLKRVLRDKATQPHSNREALA
jgi:acyl-CoA synthetase (AMP-forming)/AMP-acid ligase II